MILVHAVKKRDWDESFKTSNLYLNKSLNRDGFIHCSTIESVVNVANKRLTNVNDKILLLCIDTTLLRAPLKWERNGNSGTNFPHIYGKINRNAIIDVVEFNKNKYGRFYLPNAMLKYVKYEKSCGAIVLHKFNDAMKILLIKNLSGSHWSFPKGHMELYESEVDTAIREIKEETGLDVTIDDNFRSEVRYSPRRGIVKDVVYFVAHVKDKPFVKLQKEEIKDYKWCSVDEARKVITHINNVKILNEAFRYLNSGKQDYWTWLDKMVKQNNIIIDRPKGSTHPRFNDFIYEFDYGYIDGTRSMDGDGIDVFVGGQREKSVTGVICNLDSVKKDSEVKVLVGCNREEKKKILDFMNSSNCMRAILVDRP